MEIAAAIMEKNMGLSWKTKNKTTLWPRNSISGYISKNSKNTNLKRYMYPNVHSSSIYNCQDRKQYMWPSIEEWIKKMWYIYNGILFSNKKNEILPFAATWRDLEGIILSEVSQTEKDKYCMTSLTCGI